MDMESSVYRNNLAKLIKEKKVPIALVDDAVRRVLRKKFELGLFDDPYRFSNEEREQRELNNPEHLVAARAVAKKRIVLLKNENQMLPPSQHIKNNGVIGPMVKAIKGNH